MGQAKHNEIVVYETEDGKIKVNVLFENENLWLTQKLIAQLFECSTDNISLHLKNIFIEKELNKNSVVEEYSVTATDGKKYKTKHYSVETVETERFFATVQNKLHFAITGKTAAEIIASRVNESKENMGLSTWRKASKGKIYKGDVIIAKNYLQKDELKKLNHIVDMYLDYAEFQASKGKTMYMKDWAEKLNAFLQFNEEEILKNHGKISKEVAHQLAITEYEKYRVKQDKNYISDFDKVIKQLRERKNNMG